MMMARFTCFQRCFEGTGSAFTISITPVVEISKKGTKLVYLQKPRFEKTRNGQIYLLSAWFWRRVISVRNFIYPRRIYIAIIGHCEKERSLFMFRSHHSRKLGWPNLLALIVVLGALDNAFKILKAFIKGISKSSVLIALSTHL